MRGWHYLQTSFVPSSRTEEGVKYLVAQMDQMRSKQFDLVYYGRFSHHDTAQMTLPELDWYYEKLLKTKKEEKDAQEKAIEDAKQQRAAQKLKVPKHRPRRGRR